MDQTPSWYDKFRVIRRATGEEVTELKFTLLPERDPAARLALEAYAMAVELDNIGLATDIRKTLSGLPPLHG